MSDQAPTVFAFGDSHALHYGPALDTWLQAENRAGEHIFAHTCMPVLRTVARRCEAYVEDVLTYLESAESIETVYLLSIWRQPFEVGGMIVDGQWRAGADGIAGFEDALAETVLRIAAAGKEVVLVEPLFSSQRNVPLTLAKNLAFGRSWSVDRPFADHQSDFRPVFEVFDRIEVLGAKRLTLLDGLCDGEMCRSVQNERPIFSDNNHLAASAAALVADIFGRAARQAD